MNNKLVAGAATLSLCLGSAAPAFGEEYHFGDHGTAPGTNATLNLRVPLGVAARRAPTFGLTVGFGRALGSRLDGEPIVRQIPVADIRFSGSGLANARVASFDLAHPDRAHRLNLDGGDTNNLLLIGGLVVGGVLICWAAGCFDGGDDDTSSGGSAAPSNPG